MKNTLLVKRSEKENKQIDPVTGSGDGREQGKESALMDFTDFL